MIRKKIRAIKIISLIGMTGAGKTTVGKRLAEKLDYEFIDLDDVITQREGKSPREIFDEYGEDKFREIEAGELRRVVAEGLDSVKSLVLSCGGGIVLREENRELLKKSPYVITIWIDRPIEKVTEHTDVMGRPPINGDVNNYVKLYNQRKNLYDSVCDIKVANLEPNEVCGKIIEGTLDLF